MPSRGSSFGDSSVILHVLKEKITVKNLISARGRSYSTDRSTDGIMDRLLQFVRNRVGGAIPLRSLRVNVWSSPLFHLAKSESATVLPAQCHERLLSGRTCLVLVPDFVRGSTR